MTKLAHSLILATWATITSLPAVAAESLETGCLPAGYISDLTDENLFELWEMGPRRREACSYRELAVARDLAYEAWARSVEMRALSVVFSRQVDELRDDYMLDRRFEDVAPPRDQLKFRCSEDEFYLDILALYRYGHELEIVLKMIDQSPGLQSTLEPKEAEALTRLKKLWNPLATARESRKELTALAAELGVMVERHRLRGASLKQRQEIALRVLADALDKVVKHGLEPQFACD